MRKSRLIRILRRRNGAAMVEAAVAFPLMILTAMLLLRAFIFYLDILDTGVNEHIKALEECDGRSVTFMQTYRTTKKIDLLHGGVLKHDLDKRIDTKVYVINEEVMVRTGEMFDQDH